MLPVFCVTPLPWTSREWTIAPLFFAVIVTDPALALPCEGVSLYSVSPMVRLAAPAAGGAAEVVVGAGAGVLAGDEADFLLLPPHPATASAPDDTSATEIVGILMELLSSSVSTCPDARSRRLLPIPRGARAPFG